MLLRLVNGKKMPKLTALTTAAWGQYPADNTRVELANLRNDLQLLNQRVGELAGSDLTGA